LESFFIGKKFIVDAFGNSKLKVHRCFRNRQEKLFLTKSILFLTQNLITVNILKSLFTQFPFREKKTLNIH